LSAQYRKKIIVERVDGCVELLVKFGFELTEALGKDSLTIMAVTLIS
jgi:hypothetical protein